MLLVAEDQYNEIVDSSMAWNLSQDSSEDAEDEFTSNLTTHEQPPTNSARRLKALFKQITGAYLIPRVAHLC